MSGSRWRMDRERLRSLAGVGAVAVCVVLGPGAADVSAQGLRGTATTNVRYLTLRPIEMDTVARADVVLEDEGFFTFQGQEVFCLSDELRCVRYVSSDVAHTALLTQDISATAWGLGVQGLSATIHLRGRGDLGGDFDWPTTDDPFDAILAYAQFHRSGYRVRAGRQRTLSGLGFSGFDGVDVSVTPAGWARLEAYGGRSLARGLHEPRHEALRALESFVMDQDAYLFGGFVEVRPAASTTVGVRYQREIWADRIGLVSERASLDVRSDLPGPLRMDGSLDYDFAFGRVGKGHLTLRSRLPDDWGSLEVTGRRYLPYFELSTIWGYFSPTAYHEAEVKATVVRFRPVTLWASAGTREYDDPEISVIGPAITGSSQRYGVGGRWTNGAWRATGEYRLETGFGAFLSSGDVQLRWAPSERWALTGRASAFQQIEQFRVGENAVVGAGLGGEAPGPWSTRIRAGADLYTQAYENRPGQADWDQLRAYTIVSIPFGADPGLRGRE